MELASVEKYSVLRSGYNPTTSLAERRLTTALMRSLFGGLPFALDFGDGDIREMGKSDISVHFAPPRFSALLLILTNPGLRLGEAFMDGKWHLTRGRISDFLLMLVTAKSGAVTQQGLSLGVSERATHIYKQFLATFSATRKVARHYDVSAEVFRHIIGRDLTYSCGFFDGGAHDLQAAQDRKFKTIHERLALGGLKNPRILDIGCGWGSFEHTFPRAKSASIDGISISGGQISWAREHLYELAPSEKVNIRFFNEDYRFFCTKHANSYDRVVSIGMLEHVGKSKYAHYFRTINDTLNDDGLALIHSIVKHRPGTTNLWIDRYIFPGGYTPKLSEILDGVEKSGLKLRALYFHDGENYIRTLRAWLRSLLENEQEILMLIARDLGARPADKRKIIARTTFRMFVFYLSVVQLMFHPSYGGNGIGQIVVGR